MAFAAYPSLKGRTVLVTGGATGIGEAFVEAFHAQGARVGFVDIDAVAGERLAKRLGPPVRFEFCDVRRSEELQSAISKVSADLGPVTVLINNVANDTRQVAEALTIEAWRDTLAVNLDPAFVASTAVYPMMKSAGGGSIINVSSINALLGPGELAAYSAAKGAVNALTKSLAHAWGAEKIRVNALSPGWVITERQLELWLTPEAEAEWSKLTALKERIMPADIARAALFLASDDAQMMTGQNLVVDAGRT